ncbi:amino acid adenylation domain-containing protein [Kitasatospora sp. NPDC051170]|uniref:amino acid adenylation domain-containing protein n=1 Tax=Kitasatospora sp. NPDC051170 TaxID=3364056 RepID=UPI0037BA01AB
MTATGSHRPLSPAQRRFWFLDRLSPGSPQYNVCSAVRIEGPLDHPAVSRSLLEVQRRHEVLRARFPAVQGGPVLRIAAEPAGPTPLVDLSGLPGAAREAEAERVARQLAAQPFDLQEGPLLRSVLVRESAQRHTLLLSLHHIVSDGWSTTVLVRDVLRCYHALTAGRSHPLPELSAQYPEVAAEQEGWRLSPGEYDRQLVYWRQRLAGLPSTTELPPDFPRKPRRTAPATATRLPLDAELADAVRAFARAERSTPFIVLLTALAVTLSRHLDREDLAIGAPAALRDEPQTHQLIGPFLNTLVLRTDLTGARTLREALARVRRGCLDAYRHQDLPFDEVLAALGTERDPSVSPLFQIAFQHVPAAGPLDPGGLDVQVHEVDAGVAKFDLTLDAIDRADGMEFLAHYDTGLYRGESVERLLRHWRTVLGRLVEQPDAPLADVTLTGPAEHAAALAAAAGAPVPEPQAPTLLDLIEAHADRCPDAPAVVSGRDRLSYRELDRAANRLAHRLHSAGARPGDRVGILMERSARTAVAVLAVWKAGAACLPLDLESPAARRRLILEDAGARLVIVQNDLTNELGDELADAQVELVLAGEAPAPSTRPPRSTGPEDLAYVIYTSGSTGRPKGVLAAHRGLTTFHLAWQGAFALRGRITAHLQMANFCFDGFLGEFTRCLGSGAALVVCPREVSLQPERLLRLMREEGVDVADFVPVVLRNLVNHVEATGDGLDFLKLLIVGSDTYPCDELARIQRLAGPNTRVVNCYGVTEAAIDSTYFTVDPQAEHGPEILIGTPLPGTEAYVLDERLRPVPPGVPGTLYLAGPGLTHGYLGSPGQTAAAFLPHPFSTTPGARIYRTGDRVRHRPTPGGLRIEYLGRSDQQLKIRGYRVELGEIEAALRRTPGVQDAVVVTEGDDPTERRLHAYLVPRPGAGPTDWYTVLRESLPLYMTPDRLVLLPALPTTPNGKLDRAALATAGGTEVTPPAHGAPARTPDELRLAELWEQALGRTGVGVHDDFFAVGGNSLLALQVIAQVREEWGAEIPVRTFFRTPTVAGLAAAIQEQPGEARPPTALLGPIIPVERETIQLPEEAR